MYAGMLFLGTLVACIMLAPAVQNKLADVSLTATVCTRGFLCPTFRIFTVILYSRTGFVVVYQTLVA